MKNKINLLLFYSIILINFPSNHFARVDLQQKYPQLTNSINPHSKNFYNFVCDGYLESIVPTGLPVGGIEKLAHKENFKDVEIFIRDIFPTKRDNNPLFSSVYNYFDKCRDLEGRKESKEISETLFDKILKLRNKLGDNYTLNTEWIKETHPIDGIKPFRYPIFFIGKDKEIHGKINFVNHYRIFLAFNNDEDEGINTVNLKKILQKFINQNKLNNNVDEWINNHAKIIKFTKEINEECAEEIKSKSPKFVLKTLGEINKITETINWVEILGFGPSQKMLVPDCPVALEKLSWTIINEKEIMQDYLELMLIRKYTAALMGNHGIYSEEELTQFCTEQTAKYFTPFMDRIYVSYNKIHISNIKRDVTDIALKIKESMKTLIENNSSWLGRQLKNKMIKKLDDMKMVIGHFEEILNDKELEKEFLFVFLIEIIVNP